MSEPGGLAELAGVLAEWQGVIRLDGPGRLVLQCGSAVLAALRHASPGRAEGVPELPLATGTGAVWRSVAIEPAGAFGPGGWRLLEDGEIAAEGAIG